MTRTLKLLVALTALACMLPASASANDYVVYSCRLPDGSPAPADGWSPAGGAPYAWFGDGCSSGQGLSAGLAGDSQQANTSHVGWGFDSGPAAISGYSIVRSGRIAGHNGAASMLLYSSDLKNTAGGGYSVDYCAEFAGCSALAGRLDRSGDQIPSDSHAWFFMVGCGGMTGSTCTPATGASNFGSLRIDSAAFTLSDDEQPQASSASGSLTAPGAASGDIEFTATDRVSGIYRATIEVDGAEVASSGPASAGSRCKRLGLAGSLNDFKFRQPCPASSQIELGLAPSAAGAGVHSIRARVYDAAGNGLTVFGPRSITVTGAQASGGSGAARLVPDRTALVAEYGRVVRLSGTLRSATGTPVAGARVEAELSSAAASSAKLTRALTTNEDGRYSWSFRATASRSVRLANPASGAAVVQSLKVRSTLKLRAARRHIPALGRMRLAGSVPSARARRGASIAIKVRSGRGWRTIGVVRATRGGAFAFSYRFRRTRHARLQFRAVALKSGDLTVSPRPSKAVRIRVG